MKEQLVILGADESPAQHWMNRAMKELPDAHPNRRREWALARTALQKAFSNEGMVIDEDCIFEGYQQIKGIPDWRFSISHSKNAAGVWLVQSPGPIGLDIEIVGRLMKPEVAMRMRHKEDVPMDALSLWCLKEAAFKTLPLVVQEKIWLDSLQINEATFHVEGTSISGRWWIEASAHLLIAKAY